MKLNKTMMIAALVAGGVLAANLAATAQESTNAAAAADATKAPGAPGARGGQGGFEIFAKQLGLSEDQKTKAKPVFDDRAKQMAELRKDTTLDQAARGAKMKEIRDATNAKLKEILTPDQYEQWLKMSQHNRRGPGAGAPGAAPAAATPAPAAAKPQQ
jgi:Spy/CpxP family protein refolding chaperone